MRKIMKRQVERILDETDGAYADVIVQFKSERADRLADMLKAAVETEREQSLATDPRSFLPPEASAFEASTTARRKLRKQTTSLAANLALEAASLVAAGAPGGIFGAAAVSAFIDSGVVKSAIGSVKQRLKSKAATAEPRRLDNIGGARLMVNRGDLASVVEENEAVLEGVYENVHIKAPPVNVMSSGAASPDQYASTTWGLDATKALATWGAYQTTGAGVKVAVLDTGVDPNHKDLKSQLVDFAEFDGSGALIKQGLAHARDSGKHGTHVAGTIVGANESGRWIGMAPNAELIGGLVLDGANGGTLAQVIGGIDWAASSGADIINMSLGGLTFDSQVGTPYQRAIVDALLRGSLVVAAIGNNGPQTSGSPGNDYFALAVGAHAHDGRAAGFSGGRTHSLASSQYIDPKYLPLAYMKPDLSAPGVAVMSSVPGDKWEAMNGTSMATPHVSGAAALLLSATSIKSLPVNQRAFVLRDLLTGSVTDAGEAGRDSRYGVGLLDVMRAIDEAKALGY